ncbi:MAG: hypothetical protein ABR915_04185 [Thermoguttaceae bacterium]|jgi:hypothetical protein
MYYASTDIGECGKRGWKALNRHKKGVPFPSAEAEPKASEPTPPAPDQATGNAGAATPTSLDSDQSQSTADETSIPAAPSSLAEFPEWIGKARELLRGQEECPIADSDIGRTVRHHFLAHLERLSCPDWPEVHQKAYKLSVIGELAVMMASVGDAIEASKKQPESQPEKRPIGFVTNPGPDFLFAPDGTFYEIKGFGEGARLACLTGLNYIEQLLRRPGVAIGFAELVADAAPESATEAAEQTVVESLDLRKWSNQPTLDERALHEYKERLQEVETDLEDAQQCNDSGRQERLEREKNEILAGVHAARGLGNNVRDLNSDADRLRSRIYSALRTAYKKLEDNKAPKLAQHFRESISSEKGTFTYAPKLSTPAWSFDMPERGELRP